MSADVAVLRSPAEEAIVARYPAFRARHAHWGGASVARMRERAFDVLKSRGLPTRRVEEWKYTDLRAALRDLPPVFEDDVSALADAARDQPPALVHPQAVQILVVNGQDVFTGEPDGFSWDKLAGGNAQPPSIAQALAREQPYAENAAVALNTLFMGDATLLRVPAGVKLARPLHLDFRLFGDKPFSSFGRIVLVLEEGASATLIETHQGPPGVHYHSNTLIEIELQDGARLEHVRHQAEGLDALALSTVGLRLGCEAEYASLAMTAGAALSRHQVFATFAGEGARANIRGASLLRGRQHADNTLVVDHAVPNGESRELFKSVLDEQAHSVFQGKIIVRPGAQKTDGKMKAQALLLSDYAEADAKPELEIFADDVVCGHGATAGALDEELLFYLKARGIPEAQAQGLLIEAFIGDAVESVTDETLRDGLMELARGWLATRKPAE